MKEELKNAIKVIRKECESREGCCECPMRTKEEFNDGFFSICSLARSNPEDWEIEKMEGK